MEISDVEILKEMAQAMMALPEGLRQRLLEPERGANTFHAFFLATTAWRMMEIARGDIEGTPSGYQMQSHAEVIMCLAQDFAEDIGLDVLMAFNRPDERKLWTELAGGVVGTVHNSAQEALEDLRREKDGEVH